MFTNADCTFFVKGIDEEKRIPVWRSVNISKVYWEGRRGHTLSGNQKSEHSSKQNDEILIIIPKKSLDGFMPKHGDLVAFGTNAEKENTFAVMDIANFLYGSESVQHVEVTAR